MPIRKPTPDSVLYAWHTDAVLDASAPRHDSDPQCGWYRCKLVTGGPWAAVEIWMQRNTDEAGDLEAPEKLVGSINGNPMTRVDLDRHWLGMDPITEDRYGGLLRLIATIPSMQNPFKPFNTKDA